MSDDCNFDFNTYSKYKMSEEEQEKFIKDLGIYTKDVVQERRKQFYALVTKEEKLAFLRKAFVNAEAMNMVVDEFLYTIYQDFPVAEGQKKFTFEEFAEIFLMQITHISFHLAQYISYIHILGHMLKKDKEEKEELEKLERMMNAHPTS